MLGLRVSESSSSLRLCGSYDLSHGDDNRLLSMTVSRERGRLLKLTQRKALERIPLSQIQRAYPPSLTQGETE